MSATYADSLRHLQRASKSLRTDASRQYLEQRVTGRRRELQRESDADIRAALRGADIDSLATN
jgi:hypothetical protein